MLPRLAVPTIVSLLALPAPWVSAADRAELQRGFAGSVRPFLEAHCLACHGKEKPKAELDLAAFTSVEAVVRGQRRWETVLEMLTTRDMPPDEAKSHPTDQQRAEVIAWIQELRRHEAEKHAGDPGQVLARRLSNAEYDYTIRDLTGVDLRPTREFPVDPANEAGFDNSGESLAMSPALLKKYLDAARAVAEHVVLQPAGFVFAPHPVVTDTDRDKFAVLRIVDFYQRQPTDLAAYFLAAWRFQHRAALGQPEATLVAVAAAEKVSPRYLALLSDGLTGAEETVGPMAKLQAMWRRLPAPAAKGEGAPAAVRAGCAAMRDFVVRLREKVSPRIKNLQIKAVGTGSQPFVLWRNRQQATQRRSFDRAALMDPAQAAARAEIARSEEAPKAAVMLAVTMLAAITRPPSVDIAGIPFAVDDLAGKFAPLDPDLAIPPGAEARARYEGAFGRFCALFPDAFYESERDRVFLDRPKQRELKGRFLNAGYHNMMGYFRDDQPLSELILDEAGRRELDQLWRELDFITDAPKRQHADFIFYERAEGPRTIKGPEFDFVRSEDKSSMSDEGIRHLARVYVAKARESLAANGGDAMAIGVLEDFFKDVSANIRRVEREQLAAEPRHLEALTAFAERAYRRPLKARERKGVLAFYRSLRRDDKLGHEEAMRDTVASILVSPPFLYRIDLVEPGEGPRPLPDYALASRLSYFLWSSMPDAELLARAAAGDLHRPEVLVAQARRLLQDPRARALAVEFGGHWLDFRRFEEINSVDRERFSAFDNELRAAMFEEPVRFFLDLARQDGSLLDFLYARHTFVNAALARHYGMPAPGSGGDSWIRVEDADRYGRGGILPMAVFLTMNAPGLRTSPVKRGYWVVRRALGERIPPPPAQVPDLPNDERKLGNLTLREVLAKHREDKSCAACHARFDSFGLAFEGYGPVGERRRQDLGGRPVDARAAFPGGGEGTGVEGLRQHLRARRQDDFVDNLCRKLFGYALGRSLVLSDELTVTAMKGKLAAGGYRFGGLLESIVTSPQFLTKRGRDRAPGGGPYAQD
jgi:hypothetical protein